MDHFHKTTTGSLCAGISNYYAFLLKKSRGSVILVPKWELVGTHTGRRTFIVNALSLGITPNIVMKWTGHSDYKAMKPYIDIVDSIKASSMTKFDGLI